MTCASCGRTNRAGARFCGGCGKPLASRCPACGIEADPGAQFCDGCGASLLARPAAEAAVARKVVTIVFADLVGSTALHERLDAESARGLMDRYYRALHAAVESHGGTVVKLLGDAVMAAFGVPRVAEDDGIRAVRAAVGMQRAFRELLQREPGAGRGVGLRVAVNTGEVVVSEDNTDVVGDPVNVAAHLQQAARDGDVLIGESTRRLVGGVVTLAHFGDLTLKGRSEAVAAYRVVSLERPAGAPASAFVGRDDELRRIMHVYDTAVTSRSARLAVILGSPGLGKSRLIDELARRLEQRAAVLGARCDASGGATFAPLAEALRAFLRIDDGASRDAVRAAITAAIPGDESERARIGDGIAALLAGTPASPEETFFVVRRFLAGLAAARPVMLTIDDLQWAEPLLLDFIEHVVQWSAGVPVFVLVAARPELRNARASLAEAAGLVTDVVTLAGLDAGAATRLAANVIGADALPAAVTGRVLAASEGNPLFVGELVRMLVHDGALKREGDRWTTGVELAALEMPPTIQALLAARIERLRAEERTVLERAAVVGRQFSRTAVVHLLPPELATDLDARLESLRRSELIEADVGWFVGEPALRFHHVLVRDAAYRRLLKGTRAELHDRFAGWLETRVGEAVEHDETIGWHLEQASQYLCELGPIDERGRALGDRAARYLAAAGRRALARDDLPLAASLLGRAVDRLDATDPARADLALDWCEALLAAGEVGPAARAIDEIRRFIDGPTSSIAPAGEGQGTAPSDRLRAWHACFAGQLAALTDPQALRATADAVAAAAEALASAGDAAGEAKAHSVHAMALARLGKVGASEAALDLALAAARRADDRRRANAVLAGAPVAALWGPSPVTRASGRCLDVVRVLRITQGAPAVEAVALRCQGVLEALRGRTDAARRMIATSRRMVEELGITQRLLEADVCAGIIELLEGDAVAAERCLSAAYDGLRNHGLGIDAAQAAALLGRAVLAQGRAAEAETLSHESEALAGDDLKAAIAWRGVRAEALARRGEHAAAVELARAAVDIAAATDALLDHADARLALAAALRAAGRRDAADVEETRTIELWEAKGATLLAERARRDAPRGAHVERPSGEGAAAPGSVRQQVRTNAATAVAAGLVEAFAGQNADAVRALCSDDFETVHHPTGSVYDREGFLASWRALRRARGGTLTLVPLATLGDSLALCRQSVSGTGFTGRQFDVSAYETESIGLLEVDGRGQVRRNELFAADRLADAVARLYARYAELLSDGPTRARATATARAVAGLPARAPVEAHDDARYAAVLAPGLEFVDHRNPGLGSVRGAETYLARARGIFEIADDVRGSIDDILDLRPDALLVRWTTAGTERAGGGAFERQFLILWVFGADGLVTRLEQFDADRETEALARFDELTADLPPIRFANAATRAIDPFIRCWDARDWQGILDAFAPTLRLIDRRSVTGLDLEGRDSLDTIRFLFDVTSSQWHVEPLATRGERLALCRWRLEVSDWRLAASDGTIGASEVEYLCINEVDATGLGLLSVLLDIDALDAAYAELDDRYAAGEGKPYAEVLGSIRTFARASAARDWHTVASQLPEDFTLTSHRRLVGTAAPIGRDEYLATRGTMDDLGLRGNLRADHLLRLSPNAGLSTVTWYGTLDGGDFEDPFVWVFAHDGRRVHAVEIFDLDQLDRALARYEELSAIPTPAGTPITNAAAQAVERTLEAMAARDWERFGTFFAASFRNIDRRAMVRLELDRDQWLASNRALVEMTSSRPRRTMLATRGDRLAMFRATWEGTAGAMGRSEIDWLMVVEVDAHGDVLAAVGFDPDDLDTAHAEIDERYAAGEARAHPRVSATMRTFRAAFASRDWDALAAQFTPDLVVNDHRRLGWEPLRDSAAYVQTLRSLVDLAPDVRLRVDHIRMSDCGLLWIAAWLGSREGGAFETPWIIVSEHDALGRVCNFDQYDLDQLDEALERFGELASAAPVLRFGDPTTRAFDRTDSAGSASGARDSLAVLRDPDTTTPDPLCIPPNAATRVSDRNREAVATRDWAVLEGMCAPTMVFDDRRRMVLTTGGRDLFLTNARLVARSRVSRTVLATAGDRLALLRYLWTGTYDGGAFEVENLEIIEVDGEGRIVAILIFDPDDRRAAGAELRERHARSDPRIPAAAFEFERAVRARDLVRMRTVLPGDFVFHDHRRAGAGRLEDAEGYIAYLQALFELSSDATIESLYYIATERDCHLSIGHTSGTLITGGEFESVFVQLVHWSGGRPIAVELFELEELDIARARFEELCAPSA